MLREKILIIDFGGKDIQKIARQVRNLHVYSEVIPYTKSLSIIEQENPIGNIIAGISEEAEIKELLDIKESVCNLDIPHLIINDNICESDNRIKDFLFEDCKCAGDWTAENFIKEQIKSIKETVGNKKVLCALSGGVDSTVAAVLTQKAIGNQLQCVFVDHGLMRKNEGDEVMETVGKQFGLSVIRSNAKDSFLGKLAGVTEPEEKRKIIGHEFIEVFVSETEKLGSMDFLLQGTIYPDVIESGIGNAAVIKSHHNVGGLPEKLGFELLEPLRQLFKDEVRNVGRALGIPDKFVDRQPFPGPGLAVRCLGEITEDKLFILRESDAILREEIANAGLDKEIWQYFTVLPNIKSVGMKDDKRTYSHAVGIRAVLSVDAMTSDWARIPYDVLEIISRRIVNEVPNVNRILYDCTTKPPSTIEWE